MANFSSGRLTADHVQQLLEQLSETCPPADFSGLYQRAMELYCIVKAGGVAVQIETAEALLKRETAELSAELTALPIDAHPGQAAALKQDILDLRQSIQWRIRYLQQFLPEEEAAVQSAIAALDCCLTREPFYPN
ncbi:MAG: hypothetical protein AAGF66_02170 [Cyanobacteria bacterium P01_H01_bin.119]